MGKCPGSTKENNTMQHPGELAALCVAIMWTATALLFEIAIIRIGTLAVNITRLVMAFVILAIICLFYRGSMLPMDASASQWLILSASGLVGFVFGDWCLMKSFEKSGSRISMLMMASNPAMAAILGYLFLSETAHYQSIIAMVVTFSGIVIAIFARNKIGRHPVTTSGVLFGLGGALGQAGGLILSKKGMGSYNAFAATQIRVLAGLAGFTILMLIQKRTLHVITSWTRKETMLILSIASLLGPSLGVGLSLYALQHTNASIASSIMSIIPVLIIIPSVVFLKQKTSVGEIVGAVVSTVGVILFFV